MTWENFKLKSCGRAFVVLIARWGQQRERVCARADFGSAGGWQIRDSTEQQGTRDLNGTGNPADRETGDRTWTGEDCIVAVRL